VSQAVKIPICLYHVPSRTAHFLTVDALKKICAEANIAAIKEASSDLGFFSRVVNQIPCQVLSGDDPTYLPSLAVGGHGVISVVTNLFPAAFVAIKKAMNAGDLKRAQKIHQIILPAIDILFCEVNPCPLKAGLKIFNLAEPYLRAPLAPISAENYQKVAEVLNSVKKDLDQRLSSRESA
jgi:4-hydroxy-tetrahydrodipicolinate synthase